MDHDALASDLATYLRGMTDRVCWENMPLGSAGSVRPDVYTIRKSFQNPDPRAYEIKVSRSDFLNDVTSGKWEAYRRAAASVYFAVPEGLVKKTEVPAQAGLIVRSSEGKWRTVKRAIHVSVTIPEEVLLKLIIDGLERNDPKQGVRMASEWRTADAVRKKHGDEVARVIADTAAARHNLEHWKKEVAKLEERRALLYKEVGDAETARNSTKDYELLLAACRRAFGLSESGWDRDVYDALSRYRQEVADNPLVKRYESVLRRVQETLNQELMAFNSMKDSEHVEV